MPTVPPNVITDVPKAVRSKLINLLNERAVMQYVFSYGRLVDNMMRASKDIDEDDARTIIQDSIIAFDESDAKTLRNNLNDIITRIYTENGIDKTIRYEDPFGRPKDYIMMEGTATAFSKERALPIAVSGIYEWVCECGMVNYTADRTSVFCSSPRCVHFRHSDADRKKDRKLKLQPISDVNPRRTHKMTAQAITALFEAATSKTHYVSFQAREVKEGGSRK